LAAIPVQSLSELHSFTVFASGCTAAQGLAELVRTAGSAGASEAHALTNAQVIAPIVVGATKHAMLRIMSELPCNRPCWLRRDEMRAFEKSTDSQSNARVAQTGRVIRSLAANSMLRVCVERCRKSAALDRATRAFCRLRVSEKRLDFARS
jgi:hypothetical protein